MRKNEHILLQVIIALQTIHNISQFLGLLVMAMHKIVTFTFNATALRSLVDGKFKLEKNPKEVCE